MAPASATFLSSTRKPAVKYDAAGRVIQDILNQCPYSADLSDKSACNLYFHLSNWFGTRRQQTDYTDNPVLNFADLPFGEGFNTIPVSPTSTADASELHFTGKESEPEQVTTTSKCATTYRSAMGRFTLPD
jgi:hypothetical protein